jgi:hypothetical protein
LLVYFPAVSWVHVSLSALSLRIWLQIESFFTASCQMHRYQHLGEMMTLGTIDGAVSVSFIEGITLDGILGHTGKQLSSLYPT